MIIKVKGQAFSHLTKIDHVQQSEDYMCVLRNVTYVAVKNDDKPFDGSVPYYLSRDCFHAYVSLQLSSGSI